MIHKIGIRASVISLLIGGLLACGGGGGGGGGTTVSGIGGTGITASGTINGFGSVFVNDNEFEIDAGTSITGDDSVVNESDLRVGMVVTVRGSVLNGVATADSISFDAELEGPVADVPVLNPDGTQKTFTLLGTMVIININDTVFDDTSSDSSISFANISQNDIVEVSGFYDAAGVLHATFIQRHDSETLVGFVGGVSEVEVRGTVSALAAGSFTLGALTVNFDGSTDLTDLPGGSLANGQFVEVKGTLPTAASTTLSATRIELEGLDENEGETEVEGIVSGFSSLASFSVAGIPVNASGAVFSPSTLAASLANGMKVEVEGELSGGVLVADSVQARAGEIEIETVVSSFTSGTIALGPLGTNSRIITVNVNNQTRYEEVTQATLNPGDFLVLQAVDDGSGNLLATRVKRESSTGDYLVQGPADADPTPASPTNDISVLGAVFDVAGASFEDDSDTGISAATFFGTLNPGDLVKVQDNNPADGVADEVEFED